MKIQIKSMHIENDVKNDTPTLVYTDENGEEWVHEEQTATYGYITSLVKKKGSFYWTEDLES